MDAVGWSQPQFPDRGQRPEGHVAGERADVSSGSGRSARAIHRPSVEDGVLYTMYGKRGEEVVMAANTETGATLWEQSASMTFQSDAQQEMGNGPYSHAR